MPKWIELPTVDESVFADVPIVHRFPVRLAVPPQQVWDDLVSEQSIGAWGLGLRVRWTSARPFGVGTTREIGTRFGGTLARERFFRWDEGRRYSFQVAEVGNSLLRTLAEDYLVEPDGDGTVFTWTVAIDLRRRLNQVLQAAGPLNRMALELLPKAARKHFG